MSLDHMNKKTAEKLSLSDEQTARLLKLGLHDSDAGPSPDPENQRKELLSDMLGSKLPVDTMLTRMLPILIKSLSDELVAISGLSLRVCLANRLQIFANYRRETMNNKSALIAVMTSLVMAAAFVNDAFADDLYPDVPSWVPAKWRSALAQDWWTPDEDLQFV